MLIEMLLKFFISIVDAELFKGVRLKDLKAKDVQKSYEFNLFPNLSIHFERYGGINSGHNP